MMANIIGHILAIVIGLSLGLIGSGGSILAVPILIYVIGVASKSAIAMSLVIVGSTSIIGMLYHWKRRNINYKIALAFIPASMIGAYIGAKLTSLPFITDTFQLICFAFVMTLASIFMIRKSQSKNLESDQYQAIKLQSASRRWLIIFLQSLAVGIVTGFVGVGGGFLIIPTLVLVAGIPMKKAIGTSLLIIATNSFMGFIGYIDQVEIDWALMLSFTACAILGVILGSYVSQFINAKNLQKGFGYFVLAVAIFILSQQF